MTLDVVPWLGPFWDGAAWATLLISTVWLIDQHRREPRYEPPPPAIQLPASVGENLTTGDDEHDDGGEQ